MLFSENFPSSWFNLSLSKEYGWTSCILSEYWYDVDKSIEITKNNVVTLKLPIRIFLLIKIKGIRKHTLIKAPCFIFTKIDSIIIGLCIIFVSFPGTKLVVIKVLIIVPHVDKHFLKNFNSSWSNLWFERFTFDPLIFTRPTHL